MTKVFRCAILGPPGSGKGTLSEKIMNKFDIAHVSTGHTFRQIIKEKTELSKKLEKYIAEGVLVPDSLVLDITLKQLSRIINRNWLLDGFPRTIVQAEKIFNIYPLDAVCNLDVASEVIVNRLKGRWIHPASGRVYNEEYKPPKVLWKDDITGEDLIQREDDNPKAIAKRINDYARNIAPLLDFYEKKGILKHFQGTCSDDIWPCLEEELLKYMKPKS